MYELIAGMVGVLLLRFADVLTENIKKGPILRNERG